MVIGIEAERANCLEKTGVEHYAKQLILHFAKIDPENRYILYLRTKPQGWFLNLPKNFTVKVIPFPIFWTQFRLSLEMLLNPVDVLFIPASAIPLIHPKKTVVTIHDLAWKFYPETFTKFMRNFLEWSTGFAASKASNIISVSESTKRDLVKFYGVDEKKVSVVYHGYENLNTKIQEPNKSQIINSKFKIPDKFVLFLSTLQPRKNLEGLIDAFKMLKTEHSELPHKLVVVGRLGWKFEKILEKIENNKELVIYLNYVSDADRLQILKSADLFILPSFYEGFGMPILEAFSMGVPVVASNTSSMPEVAGDAAEYFDPNNLESIKKALFKVLTNNQLQDSLKEKGYERLKQFSWEKCAQETLKILVK
jgi:glycosyltransferase involved in cell wall biosynthesis